MEADAENATLEEDGLAEDDVDATLVDDGGTGAAIALLVALLSFLSAVAFIILRNVLFHA
ncbi:MAG TPA: hypothetical protein VKF37_19525 [Chloroflexota bacterium]|nr:hypothetical protein [Chloroflexota bacterium]